MAKCVSSSPYGDVFPTHDIFGCSSLGLTSYLNSPPPPPTFEVFFSLCADRKIYSERSGNCRCVTLDENSGGIFLFMYSAVLYDAYVYSNQGVQRRENMGHAIESREKRASGFEKSTPRNDTQTRFSNLTRLYRFRNNRYMAGVSIRPHSKGRKLTTKLGSSP